MSYTTVTSGPHTFKLHTYLKENLDLIKKNQKRDWDFKVLYSGDGMTRTGKSTKAAQDAQYLDEDFSEYWKEKMIFDGKKLKKTAYSFDKPSSLVYDESREGLDSKRQMEKYTKNLLDFFSECGNLNHAIFIVLPEYFDLPKSIAMTQSTYLINCYARNGFERGYFDFFNRKDKKYLYIKGKQWLDYTVQRPTFKGTFTDWLPFPRDEYEKLKRKALQEKSERKEEQAAESILLDKEKMFSNNCLRLLKEGMPVKTIAERLGINRRTISYRLKWEREKGK